MDHTHSKVESMERVEAVKMRGKMIEDFKIRFFLSIALTMPVLILSPMIRDIFNFGDNIGFAGSQYILFLLSSLVFFYGGWPFLKGFVLEIKKGKPGMMTLVAVATTVAYLYSVAAVFIFFSETFFWELATLVDIMLLGHWIEMKSVMSASRSLEELIKLLPAIAHKIGFDNKMIDVSIKDLKIKDNIFVKPGEKIPADGKIIKGHTSINESLLTGESNPVSKDVGDHVFGGSFNTEGAIVVEISQVGENSFISQVIKLVTEAQQSKSNTQDLADRAAFWLTIIALSTGVGTFSFWTLFTDQGFIFALERAVAVMITACPHALGLAVPLVIAVSASLSSQKGLLIKNRNAFESARKIDVVLFDKTGTLTRGEFGVTNVVILDKSFDERMIMCYASAVELNSQHLIAKAIVEKVCEDVKAENFTTMAGKGVAGMVEGREVKIVSLNYLKELRKEVTNKDLEKYYGEGKTVVFVLVDGEVTGAIVLSDIVREESKDAIKKLKSAGIKTMMITGDEEKAAAYIAAKTGVDGFLARVLPADKAKKIKEIQATGKKVAMVGDGVNDAPALATADVGIAIGAGTDVALETADVILVKNNPLDIVTVFNLSKNTYRKMMQNLIWATGYNVFMIPLAAGVFYRFGIVVNPAWGALFMSLSTIIVAINAKLLRTV